MDECIIEAVLHSLSERVKIPILAGLVVPNGRSRTLSTIPFATTSDAIALTASPMDHSVLTATVQMRCVS